MVLGQKHGTNYLPYTLVRTVDSRHTGVDCQVKLTHFYV